MPYLRSIVLNLRHLTPYFVLVAIVVVLIINVYGNLTFNISAFLIFINTLTENICLSYYAHLFNLPEKLIDFQSFPDIQKI